MLLIVSRFNPMTSRIVFTEKFIEYDAVLGRQSRLHSLIVSWWTSLCDSPHWYSNLSFWVQLAPNIQRGELLWKKGFEHLVSPFVFLSSVWNHLRHANRGSILRRGRLNTSMMRTSTTMKNPSSSGYLMIRGRFNKPSQLPRVATFFLSSKSIWRISMG